MLYSEVCSRCMGTGTILVCIDDMCQGIGDCMHGDGMVTCPDCDGDGENWGEHPDYLEGMYQLATGDLDGEV